MTRLLIVDDNPQSLYLLQVLLSTNSFELELASNGAEALELARRAPPDMIISDILMPVMDGFALCRACKQDERLKDIPFIFYTATYTDPKDEEFALSLGAERFIVKPLEPDKFLALLREILETHAAGKLVALREPIAEDAEYYKQYNAALIRKLEAKVVQLEEMNRALELDITERKQAEDALRESEEKFRSLAENANDGILVATSQGAHLYANGRAAEITGYSVAELLTITMKDLAHPDEIVKLAERLRKRLAGEPVERQYETVIVRKDGQTVPIEVAGAATVWQDQPATIAIFRDITERKRAELALREREAMLAQTEGIAHVGSWEWDVATDTVVWSDELFRIFQLDPDQGAPSFAEHPKLYLPEDMQHLQQAVETAVADGTPYELEMRAIRTDGEIRHCLARGHAEMGPEGKATRLFGSLQDITERKRAEEALRVSEEKYRSIVETTAEWIWEIDLTGRHTFSNPGVTAILGYRLEEFIGQGASSLLHAEDRTEVETTLPRLIAEKRGWRGWVLRWRHKDGSYRYLESNASPIINAAGELVGYLGADRDITERKRAEEAVQEARQTLEAVVQASPLPILALNRDGSVTMWNPAAERTFGWSEQEILGSQNPAVPKERMDESNAMFLRVLGGSGFTGVETRRQRKDGSLIDVSISTAPLRDSRGNTNGVMAVIEDITERKRAEAQLAEQLDELRRWHKATLGRETRILDLKREVNELLAQVGKPPRYPSAETENQ